MNAETLNLGLLYVLERQGLVAGASREKSEKSLGLAFGTGPSFSHPLSVSLNTPTRSHSEGTGDWLLSHSPPEAEPVAPGPLRSEAHAPTRLHQPPCGSLPCTQDAPSLSHRAEVQVHTACRPPAETNPLLRFSHFAYNSGIMQAGFIPNPSMRAVVSSLP